jgi:hypothetical protein
VPLMTGSIGKKNVKLYGQVYLNNQEMNKKFWEELIANFPLILRGPHKKEQCLTVLLLLHVCSLP